MDENFITLLPPFTSWIRKRKGHFWHATGKRWALRVWSFEEADNLLSCCTSFLSSGSFPPSSPCFLCSCTATAREGVLEFVSMILIRFTYYTGDLSTHNRVGCLLLLLLGARARLLREQKFGQISLLAFSSLANACYFL